MRPKFNLLILSCVLVGNIINTDVFAGNGTVNDPYTVGTGGDYADPSILTSQGGYYKQISDITLTSWPSLGITPATVTFSYDGDDWKITLPANTSLFNTILAGVNRNEIKNILLAGSGTIVQGGLLVSTSVNYTDFTNCRVDALSTTIIVQGNSDGRAGGLIAYAINCSLTRCSAHSNINTPLGTSSCSGGLVGYAVATSFNQCYATGNVVANGSTPSYAGGLVGNLFISSSSITDCYALGDVTCITMGGYAGGLVGYSNSSCTVTTSYAAGIVTASTFTGSRAGGIVGQNDNATLTNSYYALSGTWVSGFTRNAISNNVNGGTSTGCGSGAGTSLANYTAFGSNWDDAGIASIYPFLTSMMVDPSVKHQFTENACSRTNYTIPQMQNVFGQLTYRYRLSVSASYYYRLEQFGNKNFFNDIEGRDGVAVATQYLPLANYSTNSSPYTVVPNTDAGTTSTLRIWIFPRYTPTSDYIFNSSSYHVDIPIRPLPTATWRGYIDPYGQQDYFTSTPLRANTVCYDYRDTTMTNGIYNGIVAADVDTAYVRIDFTGTPPFEFTYEKENSLNGSHATALGDGTFARLVSHTTAGDGQIRFNSYLPATGTYYGTFSVLPNHVSTTSPLGGDQPRYTGYNLMFNNLATAAGTATDKTNYYIEDQYCLSNPYFAYYHEVFGPYNDAGGTPAFDTVIVNPLPIMEFPYPQYQQTLGAAGINHMDTVICEGDTVWKKVFYSPIIDEAFVDSMHFHWTWTSNSASPVFTYTSKAGNYPLSPSDAILPFNATDPLTGNDYMPAYVGGITQIETDTLFSYPAFVDGQRTIAKNLVIDRTDAAVFANAFPAGFTPATDAGVTTFNDTPLRFHAAELADTFDTFHSRYAVIGNMNTANSWSRLDSVPDFKVPTEWRGSVTRSYIRVTPLFENYKGGVCFAKQTDFGYKDYQTPYTRYRGVTDYGITVNPRPFPMIENQFQEVRNGAYSRNIGLDNQIVDYDPATKSPIVQGALSMTNYQPAIDTSWYAWTDMHPEYGMITVYDSVSLAAIPPSDPSYPAGGSLHSAFPRTRDYIPGYETYNGTTKALYDTIKIRPYYINRIVCHGYDTVAVVKMMPKEPPTIVQQPVGADICLKSNYVLRVVASGDNLNYEWYKGGNKLIGRYTDTLQINNASFDDYDNYYVKVRGVSNSECVSDIVTIWIVNPLPTVLKFADPVTAISPNKSYTMKVDYPDIDIPKYSWSFSNSSAHFESNETLGNTNVLIAGTDPQPGTVTVELTHLCGNRTITHNITDIVYGAGLEDLDTHFKVYPNPVNDILYIEPAQRNEATDAVIVTDINGRTLVNALLAPVNYRLSTSGWNPGVYFVRVKSAAGTSVLKILKN
ncbi:MAG: T9SS type A sorting domain-containing protein [Dysgonamonadaceae bacterium]|jgi:hypothetical protein|nr:T9SS type A sorting domain-containing protein [Dysgonamonadaceae bacterium]